MSLPSSTLYAAQPAFRPPPRSRVLNMHVARPGPRAPQYTPQCPPGLAARQANPGSLGNGLFGGGNDGIWGQDVLSVPMNPSPYPVTPQKRPSAAEYGRRRPQSQAAYMAAAQRSAGIENRMPRWDGRSQYAIRPPSPSRGPRDNWNNGRQPRGRRQSTPSMPHVHTTPPRYQAPPSPVRVRAASPAARPTPKPAPVVATPAPMPRSSPPPPSEPLHPIANVAQNQPAHIGFQNADKLTRAKVVAALLLYRDAGGRSSRTRCRPSYQPSCLSRAICIEA